MVIFEPVFRLLVNIGLLDVILPFVLVFTILYTVLETTKVLGEEKGKPKTKLNLIVCVSISLLVVASFHLVGILNNIARYSALALIFGIFAYVFANMFGLTEIKNKNVIIVSGLVIICLIAIVSLGVFEVISRAIVNTTILPSAIIILLLFFVVWFVIHEAKPPAQQAQTPEGKPKKEKPTQKNAPADLKSVEKRSGRVEEED